MNRRHAATVPHAGGKRKASEVEDGAGMLLQAEKRGAAGDLDVVAASCLQPNLCRCFGLVPSSFRGMPGAAVSDIIKCTSWYKYCTA